MKVDILDYSIYGNEADRQSDILLKAAAEKFGYAARIISITRDKAIPETQKRIWLRYDLRSPGDLDWIIDTAANLEKKGHLVFPRSSSILMSEDKWKTCLAFQSQGVSSIETYQPEIPFALKTKTILKPRVGWGGNGIKVLENIDESFHLSSEQLEQYICQPFIIHRQTWTVVIAGRYPVTILEKRSLGNDFRTNPYFGESAVEVPDPGGAIDVSILALSAVSLVTGTVDVIEIEGELKALEVNSAPCLWYDDLPDLDLAGPMFKCVMEWMDMPDADSYLYTP